jgi:hypothetical protein
MTPCQGTNVVDDSGGMGELDNCQAEDLRDVWLQWLQVLHHVRHRTTGFVIRRQWGTTASSELRMEGAAAAWLRGRSPQHSLTKYPKIYISCPFD